MRTHKYNNYLIMSLYHQNNWDHKDFMLKQKKLKSEIMKQLTRMYWVFPREECRSRRCTECLSVMTV